MSWNENFNEKRLNNICVRNIKLWQDLICESLVDKELNSSANSVGAMVANKIVTFKAYAINFTFFDPSLSYDKN